MEEQLIRYGILAGVGFLSGALGSVVAPWVHWGIEKRRMRLKARRELLESVQRELTLNLSREQFRESSIYARIRQYLSNDARRTVEDDGITIQSGGRGSGVNTYAPEILDEVYRLERKWKLI